MIWYKVSRYGKEIHAVKIDRETAKKVYYTVEYFGKREERSAMKEGSYDNYFPTFDEAKDYLVHRAETRLQTLKSNLFYAEKTLEEINLLQEKTDGKT